MSAKKNILAAAVGTTAVLGIFNTLVYEFLLNIRFAAKIGEKFPPMEKEIPEEEKKEIMENVPDNSRFFDEVNKYLSENSADDVFITNDKGEKRHAKVFNNSHNEKWAIIFHGYTSGPEGMYHYAYAYAKMGFNCLLPSMIGHSKDTHRYCSMGYHDRYMGLDWINYILTLNPDAEIVLHGESMGAATTMLITGEKLPKNVKCAVSDCGFTNCYEQYSHVSKNQISPAATVLIPMVSLYSQLRGNFNFKKCSPVDAVKYSVTPTLFVHGESDDFVPFEMMHEVYSACAAEKDCFSIKGAGHAESVSRDPETYWTNVREFIKNYVEL